MSPLYCAHEIGFVGCSASDARCVQTGTHAAPGRLPVGGPTFKSIRSPCRFAAAVYKPFPIERVDAEPVGVALRAAGAA